MPLPLFATDPAERVTRAEVIETSTTEYLAQCLDPQELRFPTTPAFGSWMKSADAEDGTLQIVGVVYHATTTPIDSVHRARALGLSLNELREQQPQIFAMLKTEFRVAIVGFARGETIHQHLPARPPQIHQAVYPCTAAEVMQFTAELHFLRRLVQLTAAPVDELLAAVLRDVYRLRQGDRPWLVAAGRTLSILLKDDYDRLGAILSQVYL